MIAITIAHSDQAPKVYGPYSQAITVGDLVYTSGQLPLDPAGRQPSGSRHRPNPINPGWMGRVWVYHRTPTERCL